MRDNYHNVFLGKWDSNEDDEKFLKPQYIKTKVKLPPSITENLLEEFIYSRKVKIRQQSTDMETGGDEANFLERGPAKIYSNDDWIPILIGPVRNGGHSGTRKLLPSEQIHEKNQQGDKVRIDANDAGKKVRKVDKNRTLKKSNQERIFINR
jgi:hypothetical protein